MTAPLPSWMPSNTTQFVYRVDVKYLDSEGEAAEITVELGRGYSDNSGGEGNGEPEARAAMRKITTEGFALAEYDPPLIVGNPGYTDNGPFVPAGAVLEVGALITVTRLMVLDES